MICLISACPVLVDLLVQEADQENAYDDLQGNKDARNAVHAPYNKDIPDPNGQLHQQKDQNNVQAALPKKDDWENKEIIDNRIQAVNKW